MKSNKPNDSSDSSDSCDTQNMVYVVSIHIKGKDFKNLTEVVIIIDASDEEDAKYLAVRELRSKNYLAFNFIGKENLNLKNLCLTDLLSNKYCSKERCLNICEEINDNLSVYERRERCRILRSYLETDDGFISDGDYMNFLELCKYIKCEHVENTSE